VNLNNISMLSFRRQLMLRWSIVVYGHMQRI